MKNNSYLVLLSCIFILACTHENEDSKDLESDKYIYCDSDDSSGNVIIGTQEKATSFNQNCNAITLNLIIGEIANNDVSSLEKLSNIIFIQGTLDINSTTNLTSLKGLENLKEIGVDISLLNNVKLNNLEALSNVTNIGESLILESNASLNNIAGLMNISQALSLNIINNQILPCTEITNLLTHVQIKNKKIINNNQSDSCNSE